MSSTSPAEGSSSTAPQSSASSSRTARYGSSCVACRRRKQKCDAKTPSCSRCTKLGEECIYEGNIRNQPSPHLVPLLVRTFDFLRSIISPDSAYSNEDLRPIIQQYLEDNKIPTFTSPRKAGEEPTTSFIGDLVKSERGRNGSGTIDESFENVEEEGGERRSEVDELLMHMSLADDGQNGHFGATSLFYQTPSESVVEKLQRRLSRSQGSQRSPLYRSSSYQNDQNLTSLITRQNRRDSEDEFWATEEQSISTGPDDEIGILKANASMLGGWESLAYSKLELESDVTNANMITYFCWQYASHCVVYRPVFIRDMALGGPYFNHFLLNVICAHATRYSDYHQQIGGVMGGSSNGLSTPALSLGADFMGRAKLLLAAEMDKGLLLLGQRECACGNLSQGWMYTG
ncbi:uncharacterized protein L201_006966 [Kwoniella dendrophila CBS 6074]|uniref:Zn(2)-C6 fungal-type domain-containing protein n=1 Tax=Kwoniella dendrophila CBS 6074 TaxID=1295534 RepID=A0AAX4K348_9TREE